MPGMNRGVKAEIQRLCKQFSQVQQVATLGPNFVRRREHNPDKEVILLSNLAAVVKESDKESQYKSETVANFWLK